MKPNASVMRRGGRPRAGRVVRGVQHDGRASAARPPYGRASTTEAKASRTVSMSSGPACCAPTPKKASTAASATAALCAWWAPCSGRKISSYSPPSPRSVSNWPPTATSRLPIAELHALAGDRGVHLDGLLQHHLGGVDRLLRQRRPWRPA